jgi:hypothetical protein
MNGVVRSPLADKPFASLRHPNVAGRSLAERMRSTTFALFGLAAAAGLALVAIFAQPGGPLLSPAPLPSEPSSSVSRAEALGAGSAPRLVVRGAPLGLSVSLSGSGSQRGQGGATGGAPSGAPATGAIGKPHSVGAPPASEEGSDENGGEPEATPAPQPAPVPAPASSPAPESVPASSSPPAKTPAVHVSLPGHSGSSHAGGKEIAATVHAVVPPPPPSSVPVEIPPVAPGPPSNPGDNGHGHGHGHDK